VDDIYEKFGRRSISIIGLLDRMDSELSSGSTDQVESIRSIIKSLVDISSRRQLRYFIAAITVVAERNARR